MLDLSVTFFGPPQIKRGNDQLRIQRRKDLALLIYLIATSKTHSRDTLAALLWQDQTQQEARSNLRKSLSRLKSVLGEHAILTAQNQVQWNPDLWIELDITQFQQYLQQFKRHGHVRSDSAPHLCRECQNALQAAVALYHADFLQAFSLPDSPAFEEWQFFQAESLRQNLAEALEHLIDQFISTGEYSTGIEYARRRLALDPFHEAAHKQLMILYALNQEYAAATRQFEECVRILSEELGTQPDSDTLKVYEAIRRKKIHDLFNMPRVPNGLTGQEQVEEKPLASRTEIFHNLPVPPTPLVGREKELKEARRLLTEPSCRLLTLLGPGGSGKTRLALHIADSVLEDRYKDGVWFVSLAPLTDPHRIAGAISETLEISGFLQGADAREKLVGYLRGRQTLLVLDNFEHLLGEESIALVADLLKATPYGQILVTSRERLNLEGEHIFQVEGLEIPAEIAAPSDSSQAPETPVAGALALFEQCARRVQPTFQITKENILPITRICSSVQGMPLAIELAAAWLQVLTPEEIGNEIERSLDFLESNWRDLPDRQRSLRAVFDSSWALLDRKSRPILKALSIFRNSFTREAAQAVAGASVKSLLDLANKSWIQKTSGGRYQIHELLRQYTFEILEKEKTAIDQVEKQYCEYYVNFSFSLWGLLKGPDPARAFTEADDEFENMRTAWILLVSHDRLGTAVDRMLPILFHYCEVHDKVPDLMKLVEIGMKAVEAHGENWEPHTEIILRTVQGAFYVDGFSVRLSVNEAIFPNNLGTIQRSWSLSQSEIRFQDLGFWGIILAFLYARIVRFDEGLTQLEQLLTHFERQGASWELANGYLHAARLLLSNRGEVLDQQETLVHYLSRAMEIFSALGDHISVAHTLTQWAELKFYEQNLKEAIQHWEAARSTLLTFGEWKLANETLWNISELYLQLGSFQKSFDGFREIANTFLKHGLIQQAVGALSKESFEKVRYGDLSEALHLRQRCLNMVHEAGLEYQYAWNYWEMGEVMRVMGDLAEANTWFERSRSIFESFGDQLGKAFYYRGMGDVALARKDYPLAYDNFTKSAELARATKHTWVLIYALTGLGRSQLALQNLDPAAQYFEEALSLSSRVKDKGIALRVLGAVTELLICRASTKEAIEVGSLIQSHFAVWRETREQTTVSLSSLKKSATAVDYEQAQQRGVLLDLWDTVDRLAAELRGQKPKAEGNSERKGSPR